MNNQKPLIKHGWLRALVIIIPWFFSYGSFSLLAGFLFKNTAKDLRFMVIQLFGLLGTLLITWIFRRFIDKKPFYTLGFVKEKMNLDIVLGIVVGFIMMGLGFLILQNTGQIEIASIDINYTKIFYGIILFIIVTFNEELLFRGYLLTNFMDSVPKYVALIIVAILFGIMHLGNNNIDVIGFSNIILAGLLLGASYVYTKSLWFPIAFHFSWNFFQGTIFGYAVSGNEGYSLIKQTRPSDTIWNGGKFGFEASLTSLFLIVVFTGLIIVYYTKRAKTNALESPSKYKEVVG